MEGRRDQIVNMLHGASLEWVYSIVELMALLCIAIPAAVLVSYTFSTISGRV